MKTCWNKLTDDDIRNAIDKYGIKGVETFRSEDGETLIYLKNFDELKEKYNV